MRMVTLDISSKFLAYAVWEGRNLQRWGKIYPHGTGDNAIGSYSRVILATFDPPVDIVVYESSFMGNNANVLKVLSKVVGSVISGFYLLGTRNFVGVPPITWQTGIKVPKTSRDEFQRMQKRYPSKTTSWLKNKDRANRKQAVIDIVNKRFNLSLQMDDNDIADAIGIGCHILDNTGVLNGV